jgi:sphingolipid 4-desaturase/C4-monooxygenase
MNTKTENGFYWSDSPEPHTGRRREMLKKYPQIKDLFSFNPLLAISSTFWVLLQMTVAFNIHRVFEYFGTSFAGWGIFVLVTYLVGATIAHGLFLAIHELTHHLAFESKAANNIAAFIANIPIVAPYAMSFKYYHALHHWSQGKEGIDADIPLDAEANFFKGFFGKFIWYINQIFFYALRPMFVKKMNLDAWTIANMVFQISVISVCFYFMSGYGIFYLLLSLFFAGGLHPTSGHFISEHYVFEGEQETYSYYGPLNLVTYNVGYHNEHHDFPYIPGRKLHELRKMAPEFYENLHSYDSYLKVIWRFISDKNISLFSRTKRDQ